MISQKMVSGIKFVGAEIQRREAIGQQGQAQQTRQQPAPQADDPTKVEPDEEGQADRTDSAQLLLDSPRV